MVAGKTYVLNYAEQFIITFGLYSIFTFKSVLMYTLYFKVYCIMSKKSFYIIIST